MYTSDTTSNSKNRERKRERIGAYYNVQISTRKQNKKITRSIYAERERDRERKKEIIFVVFISGCSKESGR